MRTAGIICECNPMHAGHRYLIEAAKRAGADAVICVMSGCFTQRGEAAILDPRTRAKILIDGGANAVFELPFPFSASGAEFFASAGVSMLSRLGVEALWFGSECGDLALLTRAAEISSSEKFSALYRSLCADGNTGTAKAYFDCLDSFGLGETLSPNDILGISYLRAIKAQRSRMTAKTVRRIGSAFHEDAVREGEFPSASALRGLLGREGIEAWQPYLSKNAFSWAKEQVREGLAPVALSNAQTAILSFFRLLGSDLLERTPELSGGLGRRIAEAARRSTDLDGLLAAAATKKYPVSRIRRGILFAMTGVHEEDLRREPAYAVLLAADRVGCAFLARTRKTSEIEVVTSHAGIPQTDAAKRQEELTERAFSLYTLCAPVPLPADAFLRCSSWISNDAESEKTQNGNLFEDRG